MKKILIIFYLKKNILHDELKVNIIRISSEKEQSDHIPTRKNHISTRKNKRQNLENVESFLKELSDITNCEINFESLNDEKIEKIVNVIKKISKN